MIEQDAAGSFFFLCGVMMIQLITPMQHHLSECADCHSITYTHPTQQAATQGASQKSAQAATTAGTPDQATTPAADTSSQSDAPVRDAMVRKLTEALQPARCVCVCFLVFYYCECVLLLLLLQCVI